MKKIALVLLFFSLNFAFGFEELNSDNFKEKIANKKVIVDFHSVW